jgi:hypothetical protein
MKLVDAALIERTFDLSPAEYGLNRSGVSPKAARQQRS